MRTPRWCAKRRRGARSGNPSPHRSRKGRRQSPAFFLRLMDRGSQIGHDGHGTVLEHAGATRTDNISEIQGSSMRNLVRSFPVLGLTVMATPLFAATNLLNNPGFAGLAPWSNANKPGARVATPEPGQRGKVARRLLRHAFAASLPPSKNSARLSFRSSRRAASPISPR